MVEYSVPTESRHRLSKCSPFDALQPEIKFHQIRLFPPITHPNPQLPSEKQILQISEN